MVEEKKNWFERQIDWLGNEYETAKDKGWWNLGGGALGGLTGGLVSFHLVRNSVGTGLLGTALGILAAIPVGIFSAIGGAKLTANLTGYISKDAKTTKTADASTHTTTTASARTRDEEAAVALAAEAAHAGKGARMLGVRGATTTASLDFDRDHHGNICAIPMNAAQERDAENRGCSGPNYFG